MTVEKLIEALKGMPKDLEVLFDPSDGGDFTEIIGVRHEIPEEDDARVTLYCIAG